MFLLKFTSVPGDPDKVGREFIGNPIEKYSKMFDQFMSLYELKALVCCDEFHKRTLKPTSNRVCRFRKAIFSKEEKFKSRAHLISKLLGNDHLLSDFECDKCNTLFSKYENDPANFLGVSRALHINNARKGSLKFKSLDKTFIVMKDKEVPSDTPKLRIESHELGNDHFTLDAENKKVTFHTIRDPHITLITCLKYS